MHRPTTLLAVLAALGCLLLMLACGDGDRNPVDPTTIAQSDLSGRLLKYTNLSGYDISGKRFDGADLTYGIFRGAGARAQRASFRNAVMTNFLAGGVDFTGSDFTGADLTGSVLTNSNFTEANFSEAILLTDFFRSDLTRANLEGADLTGAILDYANFRHTNVTEAQLAKAKSRRCMILPDGTRYLAEGPCP